MGASLGGVGVLDKAVTVLDALEQRPRSLAELVDSTGLSRATAHRLAVALEAHGLVRRGDDGRFGLGLRLIALGRSAGEALALVDAARPALEELRAETGESVQLFVREGDRRICVLSLESPHGLRTIVPLGASLPIDRGSAGAVLRALPGVEAEGWAESVAEREAGVASVSAPVHGRDRSLLAALSVSGPIERTTRSPGRRYAPAVLRAARAVEQALAPAR